MGSQRRPSGFARSRSSFQGRLLSTDPGEMRELGGRRRSRSPHYHRRGQSPKRYRRSRSSSNAQFESKNRGAVGGFEDSRRSSSEYPLIRQRALSPMQRGRSRSPSRIRVHISSRYTEEYLDNPRRLRSPHTYRRAQSPAQRGRSRSPREYHSSVHPDSFRSPSMRDVASRCRRDSDAYFIASRQRRSCSPPRRNESYFNTRTRSPMNRGRERSRFEPSTHTQENRSRLHGKGNGYYSYAQHPTLAERSNAGARNTEHLQDVDTYRLCGTNTSRAYQNRSVDRRRSNYVRGGNLASRDVRSLSLQRFDSTPCRDPSRSFRQSSPKHRGRSVGTGGSRRIGNDGESNRGDNRGGSMLRSREDCPETKQDGDERDDEAINPVEHGAGDVANNDFLGSDLPNGAHKEDVSNAALSSAALADECPSSALAGEKGKEAKLPVVTISNASFIEEDFQSNVPVSEIAGLERYTLAGRQTQKEQEEVLEAAPLWDKAVSDQAVIDKIHALRKQIAEIKGNPQGHTPSPTPTSVPAPIDAGIDAYNQNLRARIGTLKEALAEKRAEIEVARKEAKGELEKRREKKRERRLRKKSKQARTAIGTLDARPIPSLSRHERKRLQVCKKLMSTRIFRMKPNTLLARDRMIEMIRVTKGAVDGTKNLDLIRYERALTFCNISDSRPSYQIEANRYRPVRHIYGMTSSESDPSVDGAKEAAEQSTFHSLRKVVQDHMLPHKNEVAEYVVMLEQRLRTRARLIEWDLPFIPYGYVHCGNCHKFGHEIKQCYGPINDKGFVPGCAGCNQQGHLYEDCPTNPPKTLYDLYHMMCIQREDRPPLECSVAPDEFPASVKIHGTLAMPWSTDFALTYNEKNPNYWQLFEYLIRATYEKTLGTCSWSIRDCSFKHSNKVDEASTACALADQAVPPKAQRGFGQRIQYGSDRPFVSKKLCEAEPQIGLLPHCEDLKVYN